MQKYSKNHLRKKVVIQQKFSGGVFGFEKEERFTSLVMCDDSKVYIYKLLENLTIRDYNNTYIKDLGVPKALAVHQRYELVL